MFVQHLCIIGLTMQLTKHPLRVYNVGEVIAMKKLAELRRSRHISQEQVARDLGIALRSYQNYEYGQREPNLEMLCKLADYFGTSIDYILGRPVPPPPELTDMLDKYDLSEMEQKFMLLYLSIPKKYREPLVQAIEQAAKDPDSKCVVVYLPVYADRVSAGRGINIEDSGTEMMPFIDTGIYRLRDECYVLCIKGDSMEPHFADGDYIVVDPNQIPEQGDIGIFIIEDEGFVKQLGEKSLHSLNSKYDDIPLTPDVRQAGKVLGTIVPANTP